MMNGPQKPSSRCFIKAKIFPVHTLKVYKGCTDVAPFILYFDTS